MNIKPATPLPWVCQDAKLRSAKGAFVADLNYDWIRTDDQQDKDAAYIVAAANAYPKLVEALREACVIDANSMTIDRGVALLRELGEA